MRECPRVAEYHKQKLPQAQNSRMRGPNEGWVSLYGTQSNTLPPREISITTIETVGIHIITASFNAAVISGLTCKAKWGRVTSENFSTKNYHITTA